VARSLQSVFSLVFLLLLLSACVRCGDRSSAAKQSASGKTAAQSTSASASTDIAGTQAKALTASAAVQPVLDTLVIIGRLTEIPGTFAPNDLYNYVYIMKYRVLMVVKGSYKGEEILVGHYNPLIPRSRIKDKMAAFVSGTVTRFETGERHELTLITPIERVWKDAVEDDYVDSDLDKYYALRANIVR
jgi:hypothetical protein